MPSMHHSENLGCQVLLVKQVSISFLVSEVYTVIFWHGTLNLVCILVS